MRYDWQYGRGYDRGYGRGYDRGFGTARGRGDDGHSFGESGEYGAWGWWGGQRREREFEPRPRRMDYDREYGAGYEQPPAGGERDFLGRRYGPGQGDLHPRGLRDASRMQAGGGWESRYDRDFGRRGYARDFTRGYDRPYGVRARYEGDYRASGPYPPVGGTWLPAEGASMRDPMRPLGEPTWANRWSRWF